MKFLFSFLFFYHILCEANYITDKFAKQSIRITYNFMT